MFEYLKKIMKPGASNEPRDTRVSTEDVMADFGAAFEKPENLPTEELPRKSAAKNKSGEPTS